MNPGDLVRLTENDEECTHFVISPTPHSMWVKEAGMMGFDEIGLVLETFVRNPGDVVVKIVSSGGIVGWMSREWLEVVG